MRTSERIKSVRAVIEEARSSQRALLETAWNDGYRSLTSSESELYDALEETAKVAEAELRGLEADLEAQAATAQPPNSDADWRY